jgi:hypothetical protein
MYAYPNPRTQRGGSRRRSSAFRVVNGCAPCALLPWSQVTSALNAFSPFIAHQKDIVERLVGTKGSIPSLFRVGDSRDHAQHG